MTYLQAILLGLIQGATELFPLSSLGHEAILPHLLGWQIRVQDSSFLAFLVATHFATAVVLFFYFFKDWKEILKGLGRLVSNRQLERGDFQARLGLLLIVGTIPTGILGLLGEKRVRNFFTSPSQIAFFLMLNGIMLLVAERLRLRAPVVNTEAGSDERISGLSSVKAFAIGLAQSVALIPGFSRSGASMAGGLLTGLSNEDAARFSFLLATPIIGAAALYKMPELFRADNRSILGPALVGSVIAGIAAYLSTRFLLRFFRSHRLTPFAIYCLVAGGGLFAYFVTR